MTTEEQEFRDWLKKNKEILKERMPDEIAWVAIKMAGFNAELAYRVLSHYVNDRDTHTSYKIREDWYVKRELDYFNPLKDSWDHLGRYLTQGQSFND